MTQSLKTLGKKREWLVDVAAKKVAAAAMAATAKIIKILLKDATVPVSKKECNG
jgi:hypothetical protein